MKKSRRNFLKLGGAAAIGLGIGGVCPVRALDSLEQDGEKIPAPEAILPKPLPETAKHWGMLIDTRQLRACGVLEQIIDACRKAHNIPLHSNKNHEIKWIWEEHFHNAFPDQTNKYQGERIEHTGFPVLCNHCENPPCVRVCPTRATFKRKDGVVMMDYHRCIGCRFCMAGCPYGARSFNYVSPRPAISREDYNPTFPTRMKGVVEKCNFCAERIALGQAPACVQASGGAIMFGDLGDPASEIRKILKSNYTVRRKPSLGTEPSVYYIVG
jgi:molybdopterin-containing oxidoreductase family iron-sulfur binding subunit